MEKLTEDQKKQIYCVKHGHSPIVATCFGYVHCVRCDSQIGDSLGSVFDFSDKIIPSHIGRNIEGCDCTANYKKLTAADKKYIDPKLIAKMDADAAV